VRQAFTEVKGKGLMLGPPKSRAGYRTVALPDMVMPDLLAHLDEYVPPAPDALCSRVRREHRCAGATSTR
jgi:hypothetical protein